MKRNDSDRKITPVPTRNRPLICPRFILSFRLPDRPPSQAQQVSGARAISSSSFSVGAMTSAVPLATTLPCWLVALQSTVTNWRLILVSVALVITADSPRNSPSEIIENALSSTISALQVVIAIAR
jgi:hypothetical protein